MGKQVTAKLNYAKIAPRKARRVANTLKGLPVQEAEAQLLMRPQRPAPYLLNLLRSGIANAKNQKLDEKRLFVANVTVDQGPMLKRVMPRAMGRATLIQKKMSHITLTLEEKDIAPAQRFYIEKPEKKAKKKKTKNQPAQTQSAQKDQPSSQPQQSKKTVVVKDDVKKEKQELKSTERKQGFFKKIFRRKSI